MAETRLSDAEDAPDSTADTDHEGGRAITVVELVGIVPLYPGVSIGTVLLPSGSVPFKPVPGSTIVELSVGGWG